MSVEIDPNSVEYLAVSFHAAAGGWKEADLLHHQDGRPMTTDEAIADLLQHAWEGDETESADWMLSDEKGRIVATGHVIHRSECSGIIQVYRADNPGKQLTTYAVAYVSGDDGLHDHTEVEVCG